MRATPTSSARNLRIIGGRRIVELGGKRLGALLHARRDRVADLELPFLARRLLRRRLELALAGALELGVDAVCAPNERQFGTDDDDGTTRACL